MIGELASPEREFPHPHSRDKIFMHDYYGEGPSDNFLPESPFRKQNMQDLKDARRFIFTDSMLDMKSVTQLFPKDTCIFHMPRATLLQIETTLQVLENNGPLSDYQKVLFNFGPDQFRDYKKGVMRLTTSLPLL